MKKESYFKTVSYSTVGTYHERIGRPCEDSSYTLYKKNVAIAVVSDGAGAYENSELGSKITAMIALKVMSDDFDEIYDMPEGYAVNHILGKIYAELEHTVDELECTMESLSATLVLVALHNDGRYIYFHVGDGIIASMDKKGQTKIISYYEHDIADNVTTFVTIPDTDYNYGKGIQSNISSFMLMSDGAENFMVTHNHLTERGNIIMQLSHFLSKDYILSELDLLTDYYKKRGMTDDSSFAFISDKRNCHSILSNMNRYIRKKLLGIPADANREIIARYAELIRLLIDEECVHINKAMQILKTHTVARTYNKIQTMVDVGFIRIEDKKLMM